MSVSVADEMTPCAVCGTPAPADSAVCLQCGAAVRRGAGPASRGSSITAPSAPSAPTPVSPPAPAGTAAIAAAASAATASTVAAAALSAARDLGASRAVSPPKPARRSPAAGPAAGATSPVALTRHQAELTATIAEAVGITQSEAARVFADDTGGMAARRRPRKLRKGLVSLVIAVLVVGAQAWRCQNGLVTSTRSADDYGYVGPGNGLAAPTAADRADLRRALDDLMAVNAGLPKTVVKALPAAGLQARLLGGQLREWKRSFEASPDDEILAAAGARFAVALADWVEHPGRAGTYKAYLRAWDAWDQADDTWKTAD